MNIQYPVKTEFFPMAGRYFVVDATGLILNANELAEALNEAAAALNATATPAPDLTALVEAARATLDWLGPVEKSPPMLPGSGLSEGSRLVAERNVLRGMLADALAPYEQKDGTP